MVVPENSKRHHTFVVNRAFYYKFRIRARWFPLLDYVTKFLLWLVRSYELFSSNSYLVSEEVQEGNYMVLLEYFSSSLKNTWPLCQLMHFNPSILCIVFILAYGSDYVRVFMLNWAHLFFEGTPLSSLMLIIKLSFVWTRFSLSSWS